MALLPPRQARFVRGPLSQKADYVGAIRPYACADQRLVQGTAGWCLRAVPNETRGFSSAVPPGLNLAKAVSHGARKRCVLGSQKVLL